MLSVQGFRSSRQRRSLAERRVVVLPDSGIAAGAPEGSWDGVVARVVAGMKEGQPADGVRVCRGTLDKLHHTKKTFTATLVP